MSARGDPADLGVAGEPVVDLAVAIVVIAVASFGLRRDNLGVTLGGSAVGAALVHTFAFAFALTQPALAALTLETVVDDPVAVIIKIVA